MTSTRSANASALPSAIHTMAQPRRGFLAGLAALPLIGGSVALLGKPSAVAEPVTPDMIEAYKTWLAVEHNFLTWQMADDPFFIANYRNCYPDDADQKTRRDWIRRYEWYIGGSNNGHDDPYSRAALVLSTVGCSWHDDEDRFSRQRRA